MNAATAIVEKFGGTRRLAALSDVPASTIQSWKKAGVIPAQRQTDILALAEEHGIGITPHDFFAPKDGAP